MNTYDVVNDEINDAVPSLRGDGYVSIGDIAWRAIKRLGDTPKNRLAVRDVFIKALTGGRDTSLPVSFSTHLSFPAYLYECGARQWGRNLGAMRDGVTVNGKNHKVVKPFWFDALVVK